MERSTSSFAAPTRTPTRSRYRLTGNEEDARDVAQEAYLRAYRAIKRFRGDAQFSTWLYRITANSAATHLGRRSRHRHDVLDDSAPVADPRTDHDPQLRADAQRPAQPPDPGARRPSPASSAPSSCCATSTTCPTRRSPPSSASPRRRPRCASTGPARSCGAELFPRRSARRRPPMRCDELSRRSWRPGRRRHGAAWAGTSDVTSSGACAARPSWCSTARCCGRCDRCAPRFSSPPPGLLADILARSGGAPVSATPSGRCCPAAGSPTWAGSRPRPRRVPAGAVVFASRARRGSGWPA